MLGSRFRGNQEKYLVQAWIPVKLAPLASLKGKNISESVYQDEKYFQSKGQIKPKAYLRAVDSTKKRTNERICFVYFFAFHCKQNKFVHLFFGRIYSAPKPLLVLSDL